MIPGGLKALKPRKMWAGAGAVQPSVTPDTSGSHVAPPSAGCRPLVAVLLLLFIYRSSEMR